MFANRKLIKKVSITGHWFILAYTLLRLDIMSLLITGSDISMRTQTISPWTYITFKKN